MGPDSPLHGVKSLAFDLMGTCVDWATVITSALHPVIPTNASASALANEWRTRFFQVIQASYERGESPQDIDVVHRDILEELLVQHRITLAEDVKADLVHAWHRQLGWPDSVLGLRRLRESLDIVVLANGSTRLQLDIVSSAELPFHALFSSQLLGLTKPDPAIYKKLIGLLGRQPHEVAMVAAHAYDLRAAKQAGMKTIYIQRTSEDPEEDMVIIASEVDLFIDGTDGKGDGGLVELANILL